LSNKTEKYKADITKLYKEQEEVENKLEELAQRKGQAQKLMLKTIVKLQEEIKIIRTYTQPSLFLHETIILLLRVLGFTLVDWDDFLVYLGMME